MKILKYLLIGVFCSHAPLYSRELVGLSEEDSRYLKFFNKSIVEKINLRNVLIQKVTLEEIQNCLILITCHTTDHLCDDNNSAIDFSVQISMTEREFKIIQILHEIAKEQKESKMNKSQNDLNDFLWSF